MTDKTYIFLSAIYVEVDSITLLGALVGMYIKHVHIMHERDARSLSACPDNQSYVK